MSKSCKYANQFFNQKADFFRIFIYFNSNISSFSIPGVGVVLVTVSGAAWRMTAPGGPPCLGLGSSVDLGRCGRRPCSRGGGAPQGLLYPEFQHRPPPPSYQASMQEYRLRLVQKKQRKKKKKNLSPFEEKHTKRKTANINS